MDTDSLADRPWILLGGTLCTEILFEDMLDTLAVPPQHRQHIPLDQPKVEDYACVLSDLPRGAVVCGFSLGALVAAHHADRMSAHRLILFGVNPFADDPVCAVRRHDLARDVKARGGAAALMARPPEVFGPTADQTRARICEMADATSHMIDAQTRLSLTRPGAVPALARARMPVLALAGTQDRITPPSYGIAAAQAAPDGLFIPLEGLGHYALLEDPQACASAVMQATKVTHDAT